MHIINIAHNYSPNSIDPSEYAVGIDATLDPINTIPRNKITSNMIHLFLGRRAIVYDEHNKIVARGALGKENMNGKVAFTVDGFYILPQSVAEIRYNTAAVEIRTNLSDLEVSFHGRPD